jgi:hypothetical protein
LALSQFFDVSTFFSAPLPAASSAPFCWGFIADRAVPTAANPAEDFVGGLAFICLRVFDLAPTCFELVFDLTRRFDEVLDLARFFAFFMI